MQFRFHNSSIKSMLTERAVEVDRIRDLRIHLQMSALSGEEDDSEPMFS